MSLQLLSAMNTNIKKLMHTAICGAIVL